MSNEELELTLRQRYHRQNRVDKFAATALNGMLSNPDKDPNGDRQTRNWHEILVVEAYNIGELMEKEREKCIARNKPQPSSKN